MADVVIQKTCTIHLDFSAEEFKTLHALVRLGYSVSPGPTEEERNMAEWIDQLVEEI